MLTRVPLTCAWLSFRTSLFSVKCTRVALYLFSMHCAGCTGSILLHEYCVHFRDEEWALNSHFEDGIIDSPVVYVFIKHSMLSS